MHKLKILNMAIPTALAGTALAVLVVIMFNGCGSISTPVTHISTPVTHKGDTAKNAFQLSLTKQGVFMVQPQGKSDTERFKALEALILAQITDAERTSSVAYLDEKVRPAGKAMCGGKEIQVDHPHVLAFIDQQPGANWMHPCRYLLIDPASQQVIAIPSDRPPLFGVLPPTWRVAWRPPGLADWRLLPMSSTSPK